MPYLLKCQSCGKMFDSEEEQPEDVATCPQCNGDQSESWAARELELDFANSPAFQEAQTDNPYESPSASSLQTRARHNQKYDFIGGWLIFFGIGLVVGPLVSLFHAVNIIRMLEQIPPNMANLRGIVMFDAVVSIVFAVGWICVASLFFAKKRSAPNAIIVMIAASIAFAVITWVWVSGIAGIPGTVQAQALADVVKGFLLGGIWITYFCVSERVKGTFVH